MYCSTWNILETYYCNPVRVYYNIVCNEDGFSLRQKEKGIVPRGTVPFIILWNRLIYYLPINTNSTLISLGDTPLIRDACDIVTGRIAFSFSLASKESDFNFE